MNTIFRNALVIVLLSCCSPLLAQQYFRLLERLDKPYEQKIARFSNGDILLGGSPITGATSDQNGGLNLTRLDACGNVRWALNYQWKQNYMKLKDIKINEAQDIFVYGTAYESPNSEFIFLLKLDNKGNALAFRVYSGGTVDNFTYNIQLQGDKILAYGLLLDWNTPKRGFIAMFDNGLNYLWGKVFEPFESVGEAIITSDHVFLARSGFYHFKFNADGTLQWAQEFKAAVGSGLYPIAGPIEVNGGYILESLHNENAFFYKLDYNGNVVWKSDQFPATNHPADMALRQDGNILATYICPGNDENFPCQLLLSSNGKIIQQQKFITDQPLLTASIYHSIDKNNHIVNIIGSAEVTAGNLGLPSGFLLQTALDSLSGRCFRWEPFHSVIPNETPVEFIPITPAFFEPHFKLVEANIITAKREFHFTESCDLAAVHLIKIDTLLSCGQNWQVQLPNASFIWEDGVIANPRVLEHPGIYSASDNHCIAPTTYEFDFKREPCQCHVYLPTAFSPNQDGVNEKLELFSSCFINQIQFSIYNRWGDKVFSSNVPGVAWNGECQQKPAEPGVYVAVIRYQLLNESNEPEEGSIIQNIQLIR